MEAGVQKLIERVQLFIDKLIRVQCTPVFVFDGVPPRAKSEERAKRHNSNREETLDKYRAAVVREAIIDDISKA